MYSRNQITGILFYKKAHKLQFSFTDHQASLEIRQQIDNPNQELSHSGSHHVRGEQEEAAPEPVPVLQVRGDLQGLLCLFQEEDTQLPCQCQPGCQD